MKSYFAINELFLLVLLLELNISDGYNVSYCAEVIDVIVGLNWTAGIQIMDSNPGQLGFSAACTKLASEKEIFVLPVNDAMESSGFNHHQRLPVVYYSANDSDIEDFVEVMATGYYPTEGLMLVSDYSLSQQVKDFFQFLGYSRAFFHYQLGSSSDKIVRMQTFRHKEILVENEWKLDNKSMKFQPRYNFQGAKYTMLGTQNDYPYLYVIPNPFEPTLAYYSTGANIDSFDVLRAQYNFTLEVRIQLDNNWGVNPVSGKPGDSNVTYSGIYGSIINDEYDQSSTAFLRNLDRDSLFDFSIGFIYIKTHYMMDVTKATKLDWTLYIRPFRGTAWLACIAMVLIFMVIYNSVEHFLANHLYLHARNSLRLMTTIAWLTYVVVEVYYEGALTMFFTTKSDLPFKTIEEGLSMYPEYKLLVPQGSENSVIQAAQAGIKGMDEQLERMKTDPDLIKKDQIDLLEGLKEPGTYALAYAPEIRAILKQNPVEGLTLQKIFSSATNNGFYASIYPKRSPFKAAFDIGYRQMISSGQVEHFFNRRLPDKEDPPVSDPNEQLDIRQTGLAFLLLGCYFLLALLILSIEMTFGRSRRTHLPRI